MIPKVIHYCWFGRNPKPKSVIKCINSWKKYCPDYKIIEWNENNFPINNNLYFNQAYTAKKWAFATDYARLWIIFNYGGIYLDTDVKIVKSWDPLLRHDCFIGRQPGFQVNTGAGFGAIKGHPLIKIMLEDYNNIPFIKDNGKMDLWTCPHRNSQWLFENGLKHDDSLQIIMDAVIYPIEYFSPKDAYSRKITKSSNTYSIHLCDGSWNEKESHVEHFRRFIIYKIKDGFDIFVHLPNRVLKTVLGEHKYEILKIKIKRR